MRESSPEFSRSRRNLLKAAVFIPLGLALSPQSVEAQIMPETPHLRLQIVTGVDNPISIEDMARYQSVIPSAMGEIQAWYATQLDGQTFQFDPELKVRELSLTTDQIRCGGNPLTECLTDRTKAYPQAWQAPFWNPSAKQTLPTVYKNKADVYFVRGAGEQAMGGSMGSTTGGFVVIGDLGLEGLTGVVNTNTLTCAQSPHSQDWQCTNPSAKATIAHEIGHIAIMHNSHDGTTLMGGNISQGLTENGFTAEEITKMKQNLFFQHRLS